MVKKFKKNNFIKTLKLNLNKLILRFEVLINHLNIRQIFLKEYFYKITSFLYDHVKTSLFYARGNTIVI